jgi:penicillin-binding protein 1A
MRGTASGPGASGGPRFDSGPSGQGGGRGPAGWVDAARVRARRARDWVRGNPVVIVAAGAAAVGLLSLATGLFVGSWNAVCRDCPSVAQIYVWEPKSATKILDRDRKLIAELFQERRTPVELSTLPAYVPQAFVAIEDKRFYEHDGFDYRRLIGANVRNVLSGRITGGGSTITQQLARWMFSEEIGFEQRLKRKLKEARVARELEELYTKDEILGAYINQVNYGHGWHGIETAAQHYFGKPAVQVDPSQAALLAAVINRPSDYSPFRNPDRALLRRNIVLRLMEEQGYLTEEEMRKWQEAPLPDEPSRTDEGKVAPYFVETVRDMLDDRFGADLYSKGFQVVTTLDLEMQRMARTAMDSGWARIERAPGFLYREYAEVMAEGGSQKANETSYLQGMFLALDAGTGEIRAMIGGRDFDDSKFNRATQALRQPGSTFKPFVYAAAIASGIPASHVIYDSPLMLEQLDGSIYSPSNYDPDFRGPLTLRDALKHSVNTVAVKLGIEVGLETVAQTARRMGIRTEIPPYPSTPIGAASVIPLQIAEAYTAFANTGRRATPRAILRVEDADGRLLWETRAETEEVLEPMVAAITRDMLSTVIDNGTGYNARNPALGNLPYEVPAGGKTGTTNDATDVWFIGFTPDMLAAVWFGFDRPTKIVTGATGGAYGAPVWGQFMRSLYFGDAKEFAELPAPWQWPEGITTRRVDRTTGKLASAWCPASDIYTEFYVPGTEPTEVCQPDRGLFGAPIRGAPVDSAATDPFGGRFRSPLRRDTLRGDTIRRDTLRGDTIRRDTLRGDRIRRDTLMRPRPDTAGTRSGALNG